MDKASLDYLPTDVVEIPACAKQRFAIETACSLEHRCKLFSHLAVQVARDTPPGSRLWRLP